MRNVLIQMFGQVGFAIDVVPVPIIGNVVLGQVAVAYNGNFIEGNDMNPF
jgi:hypothetical protein